MSGFFFRLRVFEPRVAGAALVFCAVVGVVSCGPPQKANAPRFAVVSETSEAKAQAAQAAGDEPLNDLAALAERDVEAFLSRRRVPEAEPKAQAARRDVEIIWNEPARRDSSGSESVLARDAETLDPVDAKAQASDAKADAMDATAQAGGLDTHRLRELIVDLSKELYEEASYADMPLRELLLIAATTLVSPDRAIAPDAIPGLTDRERELLAHFQQFFIELGKSLDGSRSADEVIVSSIESLRKSLSNEPRLEIGALALCRRVGGFGDYDAFSRNAFLALTEQQAIVYIEIAGFTSELNSKNEWVTELSQQLVIYSDRDGIPVWREDWQSAVDVSRNRRNDFFVVQIMTFPKALSVGKYHLKVRLRDEKSRAEAEGSIEFEMVADPNMAR